MIRSFLLCTCVILSDASKINNLVGSQAPISPIPQKNKVCTKTETYLWCLPLNYQRDTAPWEYRYLTNTPMPWNYHFDFYINDLVEINERTQFIRIAMYFDLTWHEPRLRINKSANEWNEKEYVSISTLNSKYFWYPDLDMKNVLKSYPKLFMSDLSGIMITKQQHIYFSLKSDVAFSCQMDFNKYPFDAQECPFLVSSYLDDVNIVHCTSNYSYRAKSIRTLQYKIGITEIAAEHHTLMDTGDEYSTCGFTILYTRSKTKLFFQIYLTAGMLVIVSWTSFLIDPLKVPGRMGLLVTLLLVLVTVFNGFKNSSPPSISMNALDVYLMICICNVFFSIMQYAIVLFLGNFDITMARVVCHKVYDEHQPHTAKRISKSQRYDELKYQQPMSTFDLTSLIIFPLVFILCLIVYCMIYIHQ